MHYDQTLSDISFDIKELLAERYPRASDLRALRRKADRLGLLLTSSYVLAMVSEADLETFSKLYDAAERYLELHRYDLVRHNLESLVHKDLHTYK